MKRAVKVKQKAFFAIFKGLSIAKNGLRPDSASLSALAKIFHRRCSTWFDWFPTVTFYEARFLVSGKLLQFRKTVT